MDTTAQRLARDGYAVIERLLDAAELDELCRAAAALGPLPRSRGGIRGVMQRSATLRDFAHDGRPAEVARSVLGPAARPVKATLFDKTPSANWKVPWHQDLTIAVRERREVPGFGPWTLKDGVPHVQPPADVLQNLLAIRVHLDAADPDNGALRVVPGSHGRGRLDEAAIPKLRAERGEVLCPVPAGGAMLMRPLLLHASSASFRPGHRRVLHVEYSARDLPGGLEWASTPYRWYSCVTETG
jgi:hypothetical protein